MDDGLALIDLIPVLEWRHSGDTVIRLYRSYLLILSALLGQEIRDAGATTPELRDDAMAGLRRLSDRAFIRFLTAPRTYHNLRWPSASDAGPLPFLTGAIRSELSREGDIDLQHTGWTSLGDWCCDESNETAKAIRESPRLANALPLDIASPQATGPLEGIPETRAELGPDEVDLVRRRLDGAVAGLSAIDASAASYLILFTKVIVARKTVAPLVYASSSTNAHIGRTVVVNPQREGIDAPILVDTLIHEAIHSMLYIWELRRPFIADPTAGDGAVCSPWTGVTIPLHSYLHACWVWYGLWRLWERAADTGVFKEANGELGNRAEQGFLLGPLHEPLRAYRAAIAPEVLAAIELMQDAVRQGGSCSAVRR
jgi:hypothetical protein